jgi:hypothetical protein
VTNARSVGHGGIESTSGGGGNLPQRRGVWRRRSGIERLQGRNDPPFLRRLRLK